MIFQLGWNVCMSTFSNTIFLLFFEWSWPPRPFFFATHISCSRRFLIGSEQRLVQLMLILHLYVAKINYQIKVGWRKIIIKSLLHSYTATKEQFCVVYPMHLGLLSFFIRFYICAHLNFGWYRWELGTHWPICFLPEMQKKNCENWNYRENTSSRWLTCFTLVLPIKVYFPFVTCQTHATTSIIEPFSWLIYFALFQEYTLFSLGMYFQVC